MAGFPPLKWDFCINSLGKPIDLHI
jgi:hypothetical protein